MQKKVGEKDYNLLNLFFFLFTFFNMAMDLLFADGIHI